MNQGVAFCKVFQPLFKLTAFHKGEPELGFQLHEEFQSLASVTLGSRGDDSHSWLSATCMGDPLFPSSQLQPGPALVVAGDWGVIEALCPFQALK